VLKGALGLSPRSAGNPKRRRLAALHSPPFFRAGARWNAACSRTGRIVECGELSPLSMPAERGNRRNPPSSRTGPQGVGKDQPRGRGKEFSSRWFSVEMGLSHTLLRRLSLLRGLHARRSAGELGY